MELNEAYKTLSDKTLRKQYDSGGYSQPGRNMHYPFDVVITPWSRHRKKDDISSDHFFQHVLPKSHTTPYILYFYSQMCFACAGVDRIWEALKEVRIHLYILEYSPS